MIEVHLTACISDGRVQTFTVRPECERYATERDRMEAARLRMILNARMQRFSTRGGQR